MHLFMDLLLDLFPDLLPDILSPDPLFDLLPGIHEKLPDHLQGLLLDLFSGLFQKKNETMTMTDVQKAFQIDEWTRRKRESCEMKDT